MGAGPFGRSRVVAPAARSARRDAEQPLSGGSTRAMTRVVTTPLAPFVDRLPLPSRLPTAEHGGRLTVRMRAATHQFHRDLPCSSIWGFEGTVPGPTIEAERGQPVPIEWRNELQGPFPVVDTVSPEPADADGVPVQCLPGLSGGE